MGHVTPRTNKIIVTNLSVDSSPGTGLGVGVTGLGVGWGTGARVGAEEGV